MKYLIIILFFIACSEPFELESTDLIQYDISSSYKDDPDIYSCFFGPETMPDFPDGTESLFNFIVENMKYPNCAECIEGKVFVMFVVEEDGSLSNFEIAKGLGGAYDRAVLEVFQKMPHWRPGTQRGQPVRVKMIFPITFRL